MSWIGLKGKDGTARFDPLGLEKHVPHTGQPKPDDLITKGTVVIEFEKGPDRTRRNLLRYAAASPWHSSFRITLDDNGTLRVMMALGETEVSYSMPTPLAQHKGYATVWYTWDSPARRGVLALRLSSGEHFQTDLIGPMPICYRDADRLFSHPHYCRLDRSVVFVAMSDEVEPVGRTANLSAGALIETKNGLKHIYKLKAGDTLMTASDSTAQVRAVVRQTLPARGSFAPRIVRAPYYGAMVDTAFGACQQIELAGSKIEYLFNQESVLAEIGHLEDGREIVADRSKDIVTRYDLLLDRQDVITVSGIRVPSMNPAQFALDEATLRTSILRDVPSELIPESDAIKLPQLRDFEANLIPIR